MNKNEKLKKLFEEWKNAQLQEDDLSDTIATKVEMKNGKDEEFDFSTINIKIKKVNKHSFSEDGYIPDDKQNADVVLYILAEPNVNRNDGINAENDYTRKHYESESKPKYMKRLEMIQDTIINSSICEKSNNMVMSVMNINKRGGLGTCDYSKLKIYYDKYKDYVLQEVKILDPKLIVFCAGDDAWKIYEDMESNTNYKYIYMPHPAMRTNDEKYKIRVQEEIKKL